MDINYTELYIIVNKWFELIPYFLKKNSKNNNINHEKHGLSFEDAETVFTSKTVSFHDDRADYGEERFITLGELKGRVVVIVHTQRNLITRIISMRKANEREKKIYFKRLEEIGQDD